MTVTPQGNIYLCTTPLTSDYKNQLTFTNLQSQLTYFNSKINFTLNDFYYIKENNQIKVPLGIDTIKNCNYLFYKNTGISNKTYFCFINEMKYINDENTLISIETDVYQTYQFNFTIHKSFVEREHVSNDAIGLHTVPENLETGEYVLNSQDYYSGLDNCKYVIQCTEWSTSSENKPLATNFGGVYMAGGAYVCDTIQEVVNILHAYDTRGKNDAVYNVYMIPSNMITTTSGTLQYDGQASPNTDTKSITKVNTINGYTPTNKKLLTFPYNYLLVSNNNGSSNILHYERFNGNTCNFTIKGVPTVGGSIKLIPTNYDNLTNEEEGLIAGKFPTLNWADDEYVNWLTKNSVNIGLGMASAGINIISGVGLMATGGGALAGAGSVVGGTMSIAKELGSIYEHSLQPNSARGNINGGDINVCDHKNGFFFYKMTIKEEYAKIIDSYFDKFGYKVNEMKTPNLNSRSNWNYIKTIDVNITGSIPQDDIQSLKNMFNNGITLWHNPSTIFDYSQTNSIV